MIVKLLFKLDEIFCGKVKFVAEQNWYYPTTLHHKSFSTFKEKIFQFIFVGN